MQLTKNSLRAPLVARKERSGEKIGEGSLFHCAIVLKKKKKEILGSRGICIGIKHSRRVCLIIHCSAGIKRIRSMLEVEQLDKTRPYRSQ